MEGLKRKDRTKVETDSKEQTVAERDREHGSKENSGGGFCGYFSARPW